MTEKQIAADVLKGRKLVVLEFRKAEIKETNPTAKSPNAIAYVSTTALSGDETVEVSQFPPRGTKRDQLQLPKLERGQRFVVEFSEYQRTQYGTRVRSVFLEPVVAG